MFKTIGHKIWNMEVAKLDELCHYCCGDVNRGCYNLPCNHLLCVDCFLNEPHEGECKICLSEYTDDDLIFKNI